MYADDTVLFSESLEDLQLQLNLFYDYCSAWRLKVNISKTKAIIFSRTRPQQNTRLYFGEDLIEYVENFTYLGVNLSRNGSFNDAKKSNVKKATIAMYEILKKGRKFNLSISCQYDLFEKIVRPILLYGCEIWGYTNVEMIERVHLKFCKLLLGVKKSTPSFMIYGELGICPMYVFIKSRIINYWARVTNTRNEQKLTRILYMLLFSKYEFENLKFPWIEYVHKILNDCGLSNVWFIQGALNLNWLNNIIKRILLDQFKQEWISDVENSPKSLCYRFFKETLEFENYLDILNDNDRKNYTKYRICNHRLPIETGRWTNIVRNQRFCNLCNANKLGDEYHYILECPALENERKAHINSFYFQRPNTLKYKQLFQTKDVKTLRKLCNFIRIINNKVCPP